MKVIKTKDYQEMSQVASQMIIDAINKKNDLKICFATGGTPVGTYANLIQAYDNKQVSFDKITTFNLDEYVNLAIENPCSYHYFMNQKLFDHINVAKSKINFPNGIGNIEQNAKDYEATIKKHNGIDFMILGIGTNGHIAFNEPGSKMTDRTREVHLTNSTIKSNQIYFNDISEVPKTAISMGIGTILEAKQIILLANGVSKAQAIKDTIEGEITSLVPASFLQTHKNVTLIIDQEAASLLDKN
ncbi:glucosamine-6-phosphate deaminase [Mycoplasma sp. NEAQ87857]|uniref:glucosamine-6-phosphate deaminase n=1 Tax=Mycoplasma sp. NEAQ87857 TaxID=2683967 RepID=UPI0013172205|nr:glucosamine-6-phosphate deaminase [Mycoplasma sp. NEAQ87857]QGZ97528.1 glucosamine-6-phosphate deaminase [Mycoplasma sp. NEAQ87857]